MDLVGYLYEDYHESLSLEHKVPRSNSSTKMAACLHCLYSRLQTILQMITEILVPVHISLDNNVIEDRVTEWHVTQAHFLLGTIIKLREWSMVFLFHRLKKLVH